MKNFRISQISPKIIASKSSPIAWESSPFELNTFLSVNCYFFKVIIAFYVKNNYYLLFNTIESEINLDYEFLRFYLVNAVLPYFIPFLCLLIYNSIVKLIRDKQKFKDKFIHHSLKIYS